MAGIFNESRVLRDYANARESLRAPPECLANRVAFKKASAKPSQRLVTLRDSAPRLQLNCRDCDFAGEPRRVECAAGPARLTPSPVPSTPVLPCARCRRCGRIRRADRRSPDRKRYFVASGLEPDSTGKLPVNPTSRARQTCAPPLRVGSGREFDRPVAGATRIASRRWGASFRRVKHRGVRSKG